MHLRHIFHALTFISSALSSFIDFNDVPSLVQRVLKIKQPKTQKPFLHRILSQAASSGAAELLRAFFTVTKNQEAFTFQVPLAEAFHVAANEGHVDVVKAILVEDTQAYEGQLLLHDDRASAALRAASREDYPTLGAILDSISVDEAKEIIALIRTKSDTSRMLALVLNNKLFMLNLLQPR